MVQPPSQKRVLYTALFRVIKGNEGKAMFCHDRYGADLELITAAAVSKKLWVSVSTS